MKQYFIEKNWLTERTFELVNWNNQRIAIEQQSVTRRHWITKFITNTFGIGIMIKKWKKWKKRKMAECPHCYYPEEDNVHVIKCQAELAMTKWKELMDKLTNFIVERRAHPTVIRAITMVLDAWRYGEEALDIYNYSEDLQKALAEQSKIGWDNFVMGRISIKWKQIFIKMYKGYKQKQVTAANMIEKMYEILFNMWELWNQVLHNKTNIHPILREAKMNDEIIKQLNLGKEGLLPNDTTSSILHLNIYSNYESRKNRNG